MDRELKTVPSYEGEEAEIMTNNGVQRFVGAYITTAVAIGDTVFVMRGLTLAHPVAAGAPYTGSVGIQVGAAHAAIDNTSLGWIQVYGYDDDAVVLGHASLGVGDQLEALSGGNELSYKAEIATGAAQGITTCAIALEAYTTTSNAAKKVFWLGRLVTTNSS